jgi:hypothetical protein
MDSGICYKLYLFRVKPKAQYQTSVAAQTVQTDHPHFRGPHQNSKNAKTAAHTNVRGEPTDELVEFEK